MHILGCLSVLLLFAVIFIFSLIRGFFRMFFGWGSRTDSNSRQHSYTTSNQGGGEAHSFTSYPAPKKKVIDKDEGEYVDFEEVDK